MMGVSNRWLAVGVMLALVLVGVFAYPMGASTSESLEPGDYSRETIQFQDQNGSMLSQVDVRIADTDVKRYIGLSRTEDLDDGEGMLFVHESADTHGYVMRNMSYSLDIIFISDAETVTSIHHANPEPGVDEENLTVYRGQGKYVLEVPRGYANRTGLEQGDSVQLSSVSTRSG